MKSSSKGPWQVLLSIIHNPLEKEARRRRCMSGHVRTLIARLPNALRFALPTRLGQQALEFLSLEVAATCLDQHPNYPPYHLPKKVRGADSDDDEIGLGRDVHVGDLD